MFRALIVDDEKLARREMVYLLRAHGNVEIVGEAANVTEAAQAMRDLTPDVVFLDIQLGNESGFALLEMTNAPCEIIFTTAYDEYAIRAFELNALDYLLKPIEPRRLEEAIRRLDRRGRVDLDGGDRRKYGDLILARSAGRLRSFRVAEIAVIRASGDYTDVTTSGGANFFIKSTMNQWLERLPQEVFYRIHRSTIVNMNHVASLEENPMAEYLVRVRGIDAPLTVSRRQVAKLKGLLG